MGTAKALAPLPLISNSYLETQDWGKTPPAPRLPAEVIAKTAAKYREALDRLVA
jgi:phosphoribosylaminoimidazole-succinocarboxamide synthase